jgi:carbon-monoxide dehydrogenase small subunit
LEEEQIMAKVNIKLCVNGTWYELTVDPWERLVDVLRDRLRLTGTKVGCGEGECGACTVNMDGKAVLSCLLLAAKTDGKEILTIEGLQKGLELHPLQEAFVSEAAIQCGFCTPGMIMAANALLKTDPNPSESVVKENIANNLCRCTGYDKPVKAVLKASRTIKEGNNG